MSTYLEAGVSVVDSADILEIEDRYVYEATFSYKDFDILKRLSKTEGFDLDNVVYQDTIKVDILVNEELGSKLVEWFPLTSFEVQGTRRIYRR